MSSNTPLTTEQLQERIRIHRSFESTRLEIEETLLLVEQGQLSEQDGIDAISLIIERNENKSEGLQSTRQTP